MKRYEKMSKEEIIDAYKTASGVCCYDPYSCASKVDEWLNQEVKTKKVPRFTTIKTRDDLKKVFENFSEKCDGKCRDCRYWYLQIKENHYCVFNFLTEEIEVIYE